MIRYTLRCADGHAFEQWFDNSADFDTQAEAGSLKCQSCGSPEVKKAIMAPSIGKSAAPEPACGNMGCAGASVCGAMG